MQLQLAILDPHPGGWGTTFEVLPMPNAGTTSEVLPKPILERLISGTTWEVLPVPNVEC
jgi:hypothetical protein